jgi:hypothetical protein
MIKQPTLFVVGAGASIDLGFPLGPELVRSISEKLKFQIDIRNNVDGDQRLWRAIKKRCEENQGNLQDYFNAAEEMSVGLLLAPSIDQYVHNHNSRPIFAEIAKLAISLFILDAEASKNQWENGKKLKNCAIHEDYWIASFCKLHFPDFDSTNLDNLFENVEFISFNYDRAIAHNLRINVARHFRLEDAEALEVCSGVKIVHPYGSLGLLHSDNMGNNLKYGSAIETQNLISAASNIRTFTEGIRDENTSNTISKMIDKAKIIVFLGFGFIGQNLSVLGTAGQRSGTKKTYGTGFKMSGPQLQHLNSTIPQLFDSVNPEPIRSDLEANRFLHQYSLHLFN